MKTIQCLIKNSIIKSHAKNNNNNNASNYKKNRITKSNWKFFLSNEQNGISRYLKIELEALHRKLIIA